MPTRGARGRNETTWKPPGCMHCARWPAKFQPARQKSRIPAAPPRPAANERSLRHSARPYRNPPPSPSDHLVRQRAAREGHGYHFRLLALCLNAVLWEFPISGTGDFCNGFLRPCPDGHFPFIDTHLCGGWLSRTPSMLGWATR